MPQGSLQGASRWASRAWWKVQIEDLIDQVLGAWCLSQSVFFIGPCAKVVIFASLRAKRAIRVLRAVDAVALASGAFNDAKKRVAAHGSTA